MIVFTVSNSLLSKLIRLVTKSRVSHVAIYIDDEILMEASPLSGVRIVHKSEFYKTQTLVEEFPMEDNRYLKARTLMRQIILDKYGFKDLFYILMKNVFHCKFNDLLDKGKVCSEVGAMYIDCVYGSKLYNKNSPVTPQELLEWFNK